VECFVTEECLMRSSVLDPKRTSTIDVRNSGRNLRYRPSSAPPDLSSYQRPYSHPASQSSFRIPAPAEGWSALFLLAVALYSVVFSITAANWVHHSHLLYWSPAIGLLIGLLIAKIPRVPQPILHLGACLLGHWLAVWLTSVVAFHVSWLALLGGLREALTGGLTGNLISTEVLFFFYLTFLTYFLGYFGSWLIYRARLPWLVALVYCSILLVNLNYVKQDFSYLALILIGALILLIARVQLVNQVSQWTGEGLYTDRSWVRAITRRCMQGASVITVVALLVSWVLPVVDQSAYGKNLWDRVDNAWTNIANGRFSLQNPGSVFEPDTTPANFFGDQLTVSGNVRLPAGEVITYTSSSGPHYLEGFSYNVFDGHTWTSSLTDNATRSVDAKTDLPVENSENAVTKLTTDITVLQPPGGTKNYIFGPAQPLNFSIPVTFYTDGSSVAAWMKQKPLLKNERYRVISLAPPGEAKDLGEIPLPAQNKGTWEKDKRYAQLLLYYTQVPHNISPHVGETARSWTEGSQTAYAALKALESHLSDQTRFTYSIDTPVVPKRIDTVEWLLQNRVGYCTHYASAMAIMGRILGIPTRVMNGFSQGNYDPKRKTWVVEGSDAHSWVQAYFPDRGWVSFDPTPGFSPSALPVQEPEATPQATPETTLPTPTPAATETTKQQAPPIPITAGDPPGGTVISEGLLIALSIISLVISLLVLLAALLTRWWRNLYANSSFISGIFWRLCWIASRAGLAPRHSQTPYEYSQMLIRYFPGEAISLWKVTELFVRDRWGSPYQLPQEPELQYVERLWPRLRKTFLRLFFRKRKREK
jgi:transglutaminase-like putative cysteine protease